MTEPNGSRIEARVSVLETRADSMDKKIDKELADAKKERGAIVAKLDRAQWLVVAWVALQLMEVTFR